MDRSTPATIANSPPASPGRLLPRQQALIDLVKRDGFMTVEHLASALQVTQQTIRRDVNLLATRGVLRRHHGGASLPTTSENIAYTARQNMFHAEKQRIAILTARHIPDHASLFINLGTTTEEVARALHRHEGLRVITNNLNVAGMMSDYKDCEVIIAGGTVRQWDKGIVGEITVDFVQRFKVDFAVIGVSGIEEDGTLRDFDLREVHVASAIIAHARTVFLVADQSKFGRPALVRLADMAQIDALFTDAPPPTSMHEVFAKAQTEVFVADPSR